MNKLTERSDFRSHCSYMKHYPSMDNMSEAKEYTSIKVPSVLANKIKNLADDEGYRSVSEFMMEAARLRLRDFKSK